MFYSVNTFFSETDKQHNFGYVLYSKVFVSDRFSKVQKFNIYF